MTTVAHPAHSGFPCYAVPLQRSLHSLPSDTERSALGPGDWLAGPPPASFEVEATVPPRFLGNPNVRMPCSKTPPRPPRLTAANVVVLPPAVRQ